ncbi:MAG: hypothetical protein MHPSP_003173, partial [Paramarteilia canceri]
MIVKNFDLKIKQKIKSKIENFELKLETLIKKKIDTDFMISFKETIFYQIKKEIEFLNQYEESNRKMYSELDDLFEEINEI